MIRAQQDQFRPDYAVPPGETLLEVLESEGMSQAELAERTGRPKKTINGIIKGNVAITPDTSLQLERALGMPASFWNNLQRQYDEVIARLDERARLEAHVEWLRRFPIKAMQDFGWIPDVPDPVQLLDKVLKYFGVASPTQWESVWSEVLISFRRPQALTSDVGAVAAWLRRGEIEAARIECGPFSAQLFREALRQVRRLTAEPFSSAWPRVVALCAQAGVAVVLVPELPRTRASGATRWLGPSKALIQLSLRYKTDDQFWFTFFHEAGHILLHGKRMTFVEYDESDEARVQDEEASSYATDFLIPPPSLRRFLRLHTPPYIRRADVQELAAELGIAPGIIVGRLQHDKKLPNTHLHDLKARLEWSGQEPANSVQE